MGGLSGDGLQMSFLELVSDVEVRLLCGGRVADLVVQVEVASLKKSSPRRPANLRQLGPVNSNVFRFPFGLQLVTSLGHKTKK